MRYLLVFLSIMFAIFLYGQDNLNDTHSVLFKLKTGETTSRLDIQQAGLLADTPEALSPGSQYYQWRVSTAEAANNLLGLLRQHAMIDAAQLNLPLEYRTIPNDPLYDEQWGLKRIGLETVWENTTGGLTANGDTIVLAVLDSGFDITHPDLIDNLWYNRAEVPNDGIDNDNNGYIDDIHGWNMKRDQSDYDVTSHGTSVAGVIGAKGNNDLGISGVNWQVKVMLFQTGDASDVIAAYEYILDQRKKYNDTNGTEGAFIVATNASFGIKRLFCEEQPVWGNLYDEMGAVGILTAAGGPNETFNVDEEGDMPSTCPSDYLLTVTNMTETDELFASTGYGTTSIDIGVPGDGSHSIKPNGNYGTFGGNSAAAPHLTGLIGLLYSLPCPSLATDALEQPGHVALQIRKAILMNTEPIAVLADKTTTGGLVRADLAMIALQESCEAPAEGVLKINHIGPNPTNDAVVITYEVADYESYTLQVYNTLGQVMYQQTIVAPRFFLKQTCIEVDDWPVGTYFVSLNRGTEQVVEKFLRM